jgi:hypothetical protein
VERAAPTQAKKGVVTTIQRAIEHVRAEFMEMPGLRLTAQQVQRLCGIEQTMCRLVLDSLVDTNFLCRKSNGAYSRATDGETVRPRPVQAAVRSATYGLKAS